MDFGQKLDELGWKEFEQLMQTLLKARLGLGVQTWGGRGDWGRDAYFDGALKYPTDEQLEGIFIFQAKFIEGANAAGAKPRVPLTNAVRKECARIRDLIRTGKWADHPACYALFTNVRLTPKTRSEIGTVLQRALQNCKIAVHDANDIGQWLHLSPELRDSFPSFWSGFRVSGVSRRDGESRFAHSRLPKKYDTGVFEGREDEFANLDAAWENPRIRVVTLFGLGGEGKTALVARWASRLCDRKDERDIERYFDWSFYNQGTRVQAADAHSVSSADEFVIKALQFFGDNTKATRNAPGAEKANRLAELVAEKRTLLVLDGIEPLQSPPDTNGEAELKDDILAVLLTKLAVCNRGLCVVTSRSKVRDLIHSRETSAPQWKLNPLSPGVGARVLTRLGVLGPSATLETASVEVKGHPLTLSLMGRYLTMAFPGYPDIERRNCFAFADADAEIQGGHAFRIMEAYEQWFEQHDAVIELFLLRLLGLFDRPATPDCLEMLRTSNIPDVTDVFAAVSKRRWQLALSRLHALDLIELASWRPVGARGYDQNEAASISRASQPGVPRSLPPPKTFSAIPTSLGEKIVDTHPLVREYFAKSVGKKSPSGSRAAHLHLCDHLCARVPYWPEGMEGLSSLYQAIFHAARSGSANVGVTILRDRILRGSKNESFYSWKVLGAVGADLASLAAFFAEPSWTKPLPELGEELPWVLNEVAIRLITLGRFSEALDPAKQALAIREAEPNWVEASISASNLAELEMAIGRIDNAITDAARSVSFADESKDWKERSDSRAMLADFLHQRGNQPQVKTLFEEAENILSQNHPEIRYLYSLRGFRYCDFLLCEMERLAWHYWLFRPPIAPTTGTVLEAVQDRVTKTLTWLQGTRGSLVSIAVDQLTLGRIELYRYLAGPCGDALNEGLLKSARKRVSSAAVDLYKAGDMELYARCLITRAWANAVSNRFDDARKDFDEVLSIVERGPMVLVEADALLTRSRVLARKDPVATSKDFNAMRTIAGAYDYRRRETEIADFDAFLASL